MRVILTADRALPPLDWLQASPERTAQDATMIRAGSHTALGTDEEPLLNTVTPLNDYSEVIGYLRRRLVG
jgi:hypothetical protein